MKSDTAKMIWGLPLALVFIGLLGLVIGGVIYLPIYGYNLYSQGEETIWAFILPLCLVILIIWCVFWGGYSKILEMREKKR